MGGLWRTCLKAERGAPPTRRVGESGVAHSGCSLQRLEFAVERVVVGVADLGARLDVVEAVVAADLGAEMFDTLE